MSSWKTFKLVMMKTILFEPGESRVSYDLFTWSDNSRAPSPNYLVGIDISDEVLSQLREGGVLYLLFYAIKV